MQTDLQVFRRNFDGCYSVLKFKRFIYVVHSPFVIAQIKIVSEKKFIVKPINILGVLNVYLMMGKYHLHYKMLEDDVIYALKQFSGQNNISIVLD